jgi:hypothetical protein
MLVWPVLDGEERTYAGSRVKKTATVGELRDTFRHEVATEALADHVSISAKAASNINDVSARASFCGANGRVSLTGAPGIDVLMTGTDGHTAVPLKDTSALLRGRQDTVFRSVDADAYDAARRAFQLSGLMIYVKQTNPAAWSSFVNSVPSITRRGHTARIICPRCDPDVLMNWIAEHSKTS